MKISSLAQLSAAAISVLVLTACSGDRHGGASVPRQANFVGLWMSDAAYRDIKDNMGDLDKFCTVAFKNPSRHGLTSTRLTNPAVHIFEIVRGGTVYRWAPNLFTDGAKSLDVFTVGRIDSAGVSAMNGYGGAGLGTLRFTDFDHLAQTNGGEIFGVPRGRTSPAAAYPAAREGGGEFADYARSANGQRGFTRIDRGFAEMYVNQVRQCDPVNFPPARGATPPARPVGQRGSDQGPAAAPSNAPQPLEDPSWSIDDKETAPAPVAKAPPKAAAPDRGHTQPKLKDAAPGYIPEDEDGSN